MNNEQTAKTKEAIDRHKALPLARRIGRRLLGRYPDSYARHELRREELGAWGRAVEDAYLGIRYTKKLNRLGMAVVHGTWVTASPERTGGNATVPLEIDAEDHELKATIKGLFEAQGQPLTEPFDSVGVFVESPAKPHVPKNIDKIGIMVMDDYEPGQAVTFDRPAVEALPPETQQSFEDIVSYVASSARREYITNKPDPV